MKSILTVLLILTLSTVKAQYTVDSLLKDLPPTKIRQCITWVSHFEYSCIILPTNKIIHFSRCGRFEDEIMITKGGFDFVIKESELIILLNEKELK